MNNIQEGFIENNEENKAYIGNHHQDARVFQEVYPFATENVGGYFPSLDLKGKSLLTVGSSLDQAFNGLLLGAKNVTVYDINANTEKFYKIKRDLILTTKREELYKAVLQTKEVPLTTDIASNQTIEKINPYLANDHNYELLKKHLIDDSIDFISGDIFAMDDILENKQYDRIVLSNILQYLDFFAAKTDPYQFLTEKFPTFKEHLNPDGILQLHYLYSFSKDDLKNDKHPIASYNLQKVVKALKGNPLMLEWVDSYTSSGRDAVVTYTKKV